MKKYTLLKTYFTVFICLILLSGCNGNAISSVIPDASIQDVVSPSPEPSVSVSIPFYDAPEGGSRVMRYGQYIYFLSEQTGPNGSQLCRMYEDGTGGETLLPGESVTELLTAGGKLYITGVAADNDADGRNCILQRVEPDGSITEIARYADGLLRALDDSIYFTEYDPMKGMELAEEQERQWTDITGGGEGFSAKWIGNNVYKIDGYLYYTYSIADVPGKRYHQALVNSLPDGTKEKILDEGQLSGGLYKCGDYLIYGKGKNFPSQMWAYDTKERKKKLLFDMADVKNASDLFEIEGVKGGWVYFRYRYKDSGYVLYRISPDDPKYIETVWDWYKTKGELLSVDVENGWICYGAYVSVPEEQQYMNSNDSRYIMRSHRCGLNGSGDILFSDRTAQDPITIGNYIYFTSADKELKNITVKRYNTVNETLEELPNGFVRLARMRGTK